MGKGMKKNVQNNNFNQGKYLSPASQTFFKDNSKNKNHSNSLVGKKGWPPLKKKPNNNMYMSPYSKNPKLQKMPGQAPADGSYATSDDL